MTIGIQGQGGVQPAGMELGGLTGSTEDLIGYFQLRMKDQGMQDPAQREQFMAAFTSVLQGLSSMGGAGLNPATKQALLAASSDPKSNPAAVLQRLQQQGVRLDTFAAQNPLVDQKIASRGQNLGVYTQGPGLDQVASGKAVMHIGHSGEGVKDLQRMLNAMGANLDVDGKFGPKTEAALKNFCAAKGMSPDGVLDAAKLGELRKGGTLTADQWNVHQPNYAANKTRGAVDAAEVNAERAAANGPARVTGDDGKPLPAGTKGLLEQISRGEGTSDEMARKHGFASGYDVTLGNDAYGDKGHKPVSQMSLYELKQYQHSMLNDPKNGWNSSAVGKYQIVKRTLFGNENKDGSVSGGLLGNMTEAQLKNTYFTPEFQDKLGEQLLRGCKMDEFTSGKISAAEFQNRIAGTWASFARADTGRGLQGTGTTTAQAQRAIGGLLTT